MNESEIWDDGGDDGNTTFPFEADQPFEFPLPFRIVCYVLYNFVFLFGIFGNVLVYYTVNYTSQRWEYR